ncbi:Glucose-1-phosphate adenylyltransferase large subunit 1, chloroplastic [Tetrabaena socialis]|uniref:glucose-1-phosphate adenylyltransferase n=1 Tax=Tetrabaena socialis TaxID=47790 RepID=A0A2J8A757_9CHLO|nr:Glucose-1-phosphate adenylyltransferase large subunit 1, chloroplastic [Tetrabaena socialis]|eukprot:PNH08362.1 Glucose-1-phosphate adenylyltransferase large subunit 1, chloroplastic [Tetrabaena socialis]
MRSAWRPAGAQPTAASSRACPSSGARAAALRPAATAPVGAGAGGAASSSTQQPRRGRHPGGPGSAAASARHSNPLTAAAEAAEAAEAAAVSRQGMAIWPRGNLTAVILGGGETDSCRLLPLTQHRTLPAIPFGGSYRIIDIIMSNLINTGVNKIHILTAYNRLSV